MDVQVAAPSLTIGGDRRSGSGHHAVINPATAQPFVEVPFAGAHELEQAMAAARTAARAWAAVSLAGRQERLRRLVGLVRENLEELSLLLTLEQGKPLSRARGEIESGLRYCEAFAAMDTPVERVRDDAQELIEVRRAPLGVVAAITAWNYPMLLALWKIAPALVAGNAVIVKPSPYTPVSTLRLGELAQGALPPGVLQVLAGGDELGRGLTTHPGIGKVSFTGSAATGRAIMAASAPTLKRLTLELGGNDPGIVLPDADLSRIADDLYWAGLSNCGQVCAGLKRLFVPEAMAAEVGDALASVASRVVVGDGTRPGVDMGPVQNQAQLRRVTSLLADAARGGADVYFKGEAPEGPGYWHPVTLVRQVDDNAALVAEEQFGPVLPILTYASLDEAVERANATSYGLGASVWSADEGRAIDVAGRLEAGTVWVNQHPMLSPDVPFGGVKQSGLGVESSRHGLLEYTDVSVVRVKR
jgi:acyl-CoA reductase-like NAD-dependent aldehyde dehydrogenase